MQPGLLTCKFATRRTPGILQFVGESSITRYPVRVRSNQI